MVFIVTLFEIALNTTPCASDESLVTTFSAPVKPLSPVLSIHKKNKSPTLQLYVLVPDKTVFPVNVYLTSLETSTK